MNDAMAAWWGPATLCLALAGCAPKTQEGAQITVPTAALPAPPGPGGRPALPSATPEEKDLAERLRATVAHLSVDIGERNLGRGWNLASATDDLARTLEKMGYEVNRQGIVVGDDVVQNLDVHAGGGEHGGDALVVTAHFDSAVGSPGADDNASGAAAVIELSRLFREKKTSRAIRFALLANGEAPYFGTPQMGGLVYAKRLVQEGVHVVGALNLDGIGVYGTRSPAPRPPVPGLPDSADFVAVLGNEASRSFFEQVMLALRANGTLPVEGAIVAAESPLVADSDQWAFWQLNLPAVMITDTGRARYPHQGTKADLPPELDFDRMARVVAAVERTIDALAAL